MHLANMLHVNDCRTAQDVIARAREIKAKRRQLFSIPKPVFFITPKPIVEKKPEAPPSDPSLPCLLDLVVWPEWRLGMEGGRFTIREVQRAVARQYPIEFKILIGHDRTSPVVKARQVAMALCWLLTKRSYPEIGRRFGGKDHTSVMHAKRKLQPVLDKIKPISDTASLAKIVTLAFDAYDQFMPARKPGSGRKKSTV